MHTRDVSLGVRPRPRDHGAPRALASVAAVAAAALTAHPSAAAARPLACGSLTVPVTVTRSTPFRATDITAEGVTCAYARATFLPDISKPGAGPPSGWKIRLSTVSGTVKQDTCTHKAETITFRFKLG